MLLSLRTNVLHVRPSLWPTCRTWAEEQQRTKHDVRNRFLPWALGGQTDWRNAANDWVDGKI